jgi:hypothetical protein
MHKCRANVELSPTSGEKEVDREAKVTPGSHFGTSYKSVPGDTQGGISIIMSQKGLRSLSFLLELSNWWEWRLYTMRIGSKGPEEFRGRKFKRCCKVAPMLNAVT